MNAATTYRASYVTHSAADHVVYTFPSDYQRSRACGRFLDVVLCDAREVRVADTDYSRSIAALFGGEVKHTVMRRGR